MINDEKYVVGKLLPEHKWAWELIGVFDAAADADSACISTQHFIGPIQMNQAIHRQELWPGAWFPRCATPEPVVA